MSEEVVEFVPSTTEPASPAEPAAPVVEPPADPDESDAIELPTGKHVPLSALKAQREENKALKAQLAQAQPSVQWTQQNKPVMDFINQHPELLHPRAATPAAPVGADPELVDLARLLDYYKADGMPDTERAAKFAAVIDVKAEKKARAMMEPVAGTLLQQQNERNWQSAVAEKLPNGQGIDVALLTDAWRAVQAYPNGAGILADPRAVKVIVNTVKMQQLEQVGGLPQMPPAPGRAPVVTEDQGRRPAGPRQTMTEGERAIVGNRMDDKKYHEYTKDFRQGRPNILED